MASLIRREFGIADDTVVGGTNYDTLQAAGGTYYPPDATVNYPATGGTLEPTLERIDRSAEVRGRRAVSPPLAFRGAPVMTVPIPAYRSIVEKLVKKTLGGTDTVTGGAATGYTHTMQSIGFGATAPATLPAFHCQLVRDDLNHKMSGAVANRMHLMFPLEGEGSLELEAHGLFHMQTNQPMPTPTFVDVDNVLMLRDAQVTLDGSGAALPTPTLPTLTPSGTGGTIAAGTTYNYRIVAYSSNGVTLPGPEAASAATTTGATSSILVTWSAVSGAAGYRVYGRLAGAELFMADVGNTLTFTDTGAITPAGALPTANTTGGIIPDLIAFEFTFINNVIKKWYSRRNIWTTTTGVGALARTSKLWYPTEFKIGAEQDVSYVMHFGNTNTAQDLLRDFAAVQQIVFNVIGGPVPGSSPTVYESLQITIQAGVHAGGAGPDPLVARGDTTYRVEGGGFYSSTAGYDVQIAVLNQNAAALT